METTLKITHIGKFYPPEHGGIESVTAALAETHAALGHEVTVVCFTAQQPAQSQQGGLKLVRCKARMSIASQPLGVRYFFQALKQSRRADIVHIHTPNILAALAAVFLGKNAKIVLHWHADISGKGLIGRMIRPLEKQMLKRADAIICTTQIYADSSAALAPFQAKLGVIPIGIEDEPCPPAKTPDVEAWLAWAKGRPLILSVGRLVPYKGLDTLLAAATRLKGKAAFIIVGGGPLQEGLQAEILRLNLADTVRLVGRQSVENLNDLFARCDLFCMASNDRAEAFGVVLLEAMRAGLPIIATKIPDSGVSWVNLHEYSGENITPNDAGQLAEAIARLTSDPRLLASYGRQARMRYESKFTQEQMTTGFLALYHGLIRDTLSQKP